ncbi:hypothetical protein AB4Z40_26950 [Bosea sp. 2YAB26]|uniref:hypothetical protein n=2 Tax=Pseudomonadota TaxID=1224 RepID=UPI003F921CC6
MTKATYTDWMAVLERMERTQREHYLAGHDDEGDALGKQIEQWILAGRAQGYCVRDGRPLTDTRHPSETSLAGEMQRQSGQHRSSKH